MTRLRWTGGPARATIDRSRRGRAPARRGRPPDDRSESLPLRSASLLTPFDLALYGGTVFVWSTSWIALALQIGPVPAEVSAFWRFALAALLMVGWVVATGRPMHFSWRDHLRFAAMGVTLFSTNFLLFYYGSHYLASGLLAVVFSLTAVVNMLLAALLLGQRMEARVLAGAVAGFVGVGLMFLPELEGEHLGGGALVGLGYCVTATVSFCVGNILSAGAQRRGLPVLPATAWGMTYGAVFLGLIAALRGFSFAITPDPTYLASLLWLAVFSSVVAFACYLTLLGRIGAARAGYATVMFPVFALAISTVFEGYHWTLPALAGLVLALAGNLLVLRRRPG